MSTQLQKTATERKTKRYHPKLSDKVMTDQKYKNSCDINNIVKQFAKTGILPTNNKMPQYGDFSAIPTLEAAFDTAQTAVDAFLSLPATIRKLLDNDPANLEKFVSNEENKEICEKYGLIEKPAKLDTAQHDKPDTTNNSTNDSKPDNNSSTGENNDSNSKTTI